MRSLSNGKREDGFTFAELMTIIAIIAILSSIAIPAFSVWLPNYRLRSAARDLYSNLQMAKLGAVKQNRQWAIVFNQVTNQYYVCSDDGADDVWNGPSPGGDDDCEKTVDLNNYDDIYFGHGTLTTDILGDTFSGGDHIYYANNFVVFSPRGTSEKGYVYLQNDKDTVYGVGTRPSGVIHLLKYTGPPAPLWE